MAEAMSYSATLKFLLVPSMVLMASSFSALFFKIPKNVEGALQHFAGGVVLSATATELVPEMLKPEAPIWAVSLGFGLAVVFFLTIRNTLGHGHGGGGDEGGHGHGGGGEEEGHGGHGGGKVAGEGGHGHGGSPKEHGGEGHGHGHGNDDGYQSMDKNAAVPWGSVAPTLVDFMCDGMLTGLSFAAGATAGLILVLSIALEMASVGAAVFAGMMSKKVSTGKALAVMFLLACALYGSGVAAFSLADKLAGTTLYYGMLSFGICACLWLACEDLLKEAHEEEEEKNWVTAMFFLGFLLPVVLHKLESGGE